MISTLGRFSAPLVAVVALAGLVPLGCGEPVREDRTITWSAEGKGVGFQHGEQGVFVADKEGGKLEKVFQPDPDVIATSTPLWSPKGRRMIFTTARSAVEGAPTQGAALWNGGEPDPAGNLYLGVPIVYTCWLRGEEEGAKPLKLFEAKCDHAGYVAANLAVRWHPMGDRILYVDQTTDGRHALLAYELETKASQQFFPHEAQALVFDWSPGGDQLACVLGTPGNGSDRDGIWIGSPDREDWWHVPETRELARAELPSLLERLRASRPAWTPDGARFAFVTQLPGQPGGRPGDSRLRIGTVADRRVEEAAKESAEILDLHWSPRGERLGLVRGGPEPSLHTWSPAAGRSGSLNTQPMRRFAGWCATGDHLAYVVPDAIPGADGPLWSFLLTPDPLARDAVVIADGAGQGAGKPVFSGLRVTFPHWSPTEDTLSLWCTFSPSHRSSLSRMLGGGLRPGDPAAILDARTGSLSWMTISPQEEAQVGHYHLLKRQYNEAMRRYQLAEKADPEPGPKTAAQWVNRLLSPRGIDVFQYLCLTKLGRHEEARAQLERFRRSYPPRPPATPQDGSNAARPGFPLDQPWFQEALKPDGLFARLLQDLYIAEVLLSVDAAEDGRRFFRAIVDSGAAEPDSVRLSAAVVLSQILLIERRHDDYTDLATEVIAPMLLKVRGARPAQTTPEALDLVRQFPDVVGGLTMLPLMSKPFLDAVSAERVGSLVSHWEALRVRLTDDRARLAVDLALEASYRRLCREPERLEAAERLQRNPASLGADLARGVSDEMLQSLRGIVSGAGFGLAATPAPGVR